MGVIAPAGRQTGINSGRQAGSTSDSHFTAAGQALRCAYAAGPGTPCGTLIEPHICDTRRNQALTLSVTVAKK